MSPEQREALYTLIENAIDAAGPGDALFEAEVPRTSRGQSKARKVVKIYGTTGSLVESSDPGCVTVGVDFTIQCQVLPDGKPDDVAKLEEAEADSWRMAQAVFLAIRANQSLDGAVSIADANAYETSSFNIGATVYGATYLDGVINPMGQG